MMPAAAADADTDVRTELAARLLHARLVSYSYAAPALCSPPSSPSASSTAPATATLASPYTPHLSTRARRAPPVRAALPTAALAQPSIDALLAAETGQGTPHSSHAVPSMAPPLPPLSTSLSAPSLGPSTPRDLPRSQPASAKHTTNVTDAQGDRDDTGAVLPGCSWMPTGTKDIYADVFGPLLHAPGSPAATQSHAQAQAQAPMVSPSPRRHGHKHGRSHGHTPHRRTPSLGSFGSIGAMTPSASDSAMRTGACLPRGTPGTRHSKAPYAHGQGSGYDCVSPTIERERNVERSVDRERDPIRRRRMRHAAPQPYGSQPMTMPATPMSGGVVRSSRSASVTASGSRKPALSLAHVLGLRSPVSMSIQSASGSVSAQPGAELDPASPLAQRRRPARTGADASPSRHGHQPSHGNDFDKAADDAAQVMLLLAASPSPVPPKPRSSYARHEQTQVHKRAPSPTIRSPRRTRAPVVGLGLGIQLPSGSKAELHGADVRDEVHMALNPPDGSDEPEVPELHSQSSSQETVDSYTSLPTSASTSTTDAEPVPSPVPVLGGRRESEMIMPPPSVPFAPNAQPRMVPRTPERAQAKPSHKRQLRTPPRTPPNQVAGAVATPQAPGSTVGSTVSFVERNVSPSPLPRSRSACMFTPGGSRPPMRTAGAGHGHTRSGTTPGKRVSTPSRPPTVKDHHYRWEQLTPGPRRGHSAGHSHSHSHSHSLSHGHVRAWAASPSVPTKATARPILDSANPLTSFPTSLSSPTLSTNGTNTATAPPPVPCARAPAPEQVLARP